jgi:hypothetical protein
MIDAVAVSPYNLPWDTRAALRCRHYPRGGPFGLCTRIHVFSQDDERLARLGVAALLSLFGYLIVPGIIAAVPRLFLGDAIAGVSDRPFLRANRPPCRQYQGSYR